MTGKRIGPVVTVHMSCIGCQHEESESYAVQGDSGHDVYCNHGGERRSVGDSTWNTPKWCPLRNIALSAEVEARLRAAAGGGEHG